MYAADGDASPAKDKTWLMAASPAAALVIIITPPWHRRHLTNGTATLDILTEAVFGCATFNSPMHDNREVVLAVGGYEASHCSSPRLFPTQIPAWTTSNYYSFIWLFYLTVLHYSWNGTTFCLKTMLSFILHPRDWCVILPSLWIQVILADLQLINIDISIDMWYKGFMDLPISQE